MNNRIKELRYVKASALAPDARNPRRHPQAQRVALQAMLADVGIADAVIARETPAGLVLIDGHLRADLDPEQMLPVLVTDLDEAEAGKVLATLDPLSAMATKDGGALARLIAESSPPIDLAKMFPDVDLADIVGAVVDPNDEWVGMPEFENTSKAYYLTIKVHFYDQEGVDDFLATVQRPIPARNFIHWPEVRSAWEMTSQRVYDEQTSDAEQ